MDPRIRMAKERRLTLLLFNGFVVVLIGIMAFLSNSPQKSVHDSDPSSVGVVGQGR